MDRVLIFTFSCMFGSKDMTLFEGGSIGAYE